MVLTGSSGVPGVIQEEYDARTAFRKLTSHLLDTWQMDIGLILTNKGIPANEGRAEGFRDAMTARSNMNPAICWDAVDNKLMVKALIELYCAGVHGVICGDDEELRAMANTVRLASFHSNRFLQMFHPEIPTVVMDPTNLGEFAARLVIHEIEEGNTPPSTQLEYKLHLP